MLRDAVMCHKTGDATLLRYSSSPWALFQEFFRCLSLVGIVAASHFEHLKLFGCKCAGCLILLHYVCCVLHLAKSFIIIYFFLSFFFLICIANPAAPSNVILAECSYLYGLPSFSGPTPSFRVQQPQTQKILSSHTDKCICLNAAISYESNFHPSLWTMPVLIPSLATLQTKSFQLLSWQCLTPSLPVVLMHFVWLRKEAKIQLTHPTGLLAKRPH